MLKRKNNIVRCKILEMFYFICTVLFIFLLVGCTNYNSFLQKNLPTVGFEEFSLTTDYGPFFSLNVNAKDLEKDEDMIILDTVEYHRTGNFSSTHVTIKGYHRELFKEK